MRSPGGSGGLRTSRAFREGELVHKREGDNLAGFRQGHESECLE